MTWQTEIINPALRRIGVLAGDEAPDARMSIDAHATLNALLDSFKLDDLLIHQQTRTPWTIGAGDGVYTVGATGDITIDRPQFIDGVSYLTPTDASASEEAVEWDSSTAVNVAIDGSSLQKNGGVDGTYDAGAHSTKQLLSGDGYVDFVGTPGLAHAFTMGLSNGFSSGVQAGIEFGIAPSATGTGLISIVEQGVLRATGAVYVAGDVLRVSLADGVVYYYVNGTLFYTSTATPAYPLHVEGAFRWDAGILVSATISGAWSSTGVSQIGQETPLTKLDDQEYRVWPRKQETATYPSHWHYDKTYPNATLRLLPVPTSANLQGLLYWQQPLAEVDALTDAVSIPRGYRKLLIDCLALELCPEYGVDVHPVLARDVERIKSKVMRSNLRIGDLSMAGTPGNYGRYDIMTGQ